MEQVFYTTPFLFSDSPLGLMDPRPNVSIGSWNLSSDSGFYYLLLIISVLVVLLVTSISNGRLGRLLDALSDSPVALETQGLNTSTLKVIVFCITACIASLAGALTGQLYHFAVGLVLSVLHFARIGCHRDDRRGRRSVVRGAGGSRLWRRSRLHQWQYQHMADPSFRDHSRNGRLQQPGRSDARGRAAAPRQDRGPQTGGDVHARRSTCCHESC